MPPATMFRFKSWSSTSSGATTPPSPARTMPIPLDKGWTLLELAADAGGIDTSDSDNIHIHRRVFYNTLSLRPDQASGGQSPSPSLRLKTEGLTTKSTPSHSPPLSMQSSLSPLDILQLKITQQRAYITLQAELAEALDAALAAKAALTAVEVENVSLKRRLEKESGQGDKPVEEVTEARHGVGKSGTEDTPGDSEAADGGPAHDLDSPEHDRSSRQPEQIEPIDELPRDEFPHEAEGVNFPLVDTPSDVSQSSSTDTAIPTTTTDGNLPIPSSRRNQTGRRRSRRSTAPPGMIAPPTSLAVENIHLRAKLGQCREVIEGLVSWGVALGDENVILREQVGEAVPPRGAWRPDVSALLELLD